MLLLLQLLQLLQMLLLLRMLLQLLRMLLLLWMLLLQLLQMLLLLRMLLLLHLLMLLLHGGRLHPEQLVDLLLLLDLLLDLLMDLLLLLLQDLLVVLADLQILLVLLLHLNLGRLHRVGHRQRRRAADSCQTGASQGWRLRWQTKMRRDAGEEVVRRRVLLWRKAGESGASQEGVRRVQRRAETGREAGGLRHRRKRRRKLTMLRRR